MSDGIRIRPTHAMVAELATGMDEVFRDAMKHLPPKIDEQDRKKLYRFHWDCGRNGDITSTLLLSDREIESHLGQTACFGEVLGKHSHIEGTFDREDLTLLTDDPDFIDKAKAYGLVPRGLNPIHAIDHPEEYE